MIDVIPRDIQAFLLLPEEYFTTTKINILKTSLIERRADVK